MTRLYYFRGLFGLYETEAGDEGWVLIEATPSRGSFPFDQTGYPGEEVLLLQESLARE